jgi:DNA repair protein RadC
MPKNAESLSILSQLDESEKPGIITDEELEEIGAAYGSREKYHEAMQALAVYLSGAAPRRPASILGGMGKAPPRINRGTSAVPLGEIQRAKRINIVGKAINAPDDAAKLFSAFRDPRIEIFNIAYASLTGEILAHTAWTSGLPGIVRAYGNGIQNDKFSRISDIKNKLGADKIWIAHNHPSGDPEPSPEDISTTKNYHSFFGSGFAGHIVLDHDKYSLIAPDGQHSIYSLRKPARNFVSRRREQSTVISSPEAVASMFKKVLSNKEDVSAFAVLDGGNRVVSWIYGSHDYVHGIKKYMRVSGGSKVIVLSNSGALHKKFSVMAEGARGTKNDIFLDVIKVSRATGLFDESLAEKSYPGGKWQLHESERIKYIAHNQTMQPELGLSLSGQNTVKGYSRDAGWDDANVLIRDFKNPCFFKIGSADRSIAAVLSIYDSREAMQSDSPYATFNIPGDIKAAKQLVNHAIEDIMLFDDAKDLFIHDITRHLGMQLNSLKREIAAAEPTAQYSDPSPAGRNNNSKEKNMSDDYYVISFQKDSERLVEIEEIEHRVKFDRQYLETKYGSSYKMYGPYFELGGAVKMSVEIENRIERETNSLQKINDHISNNSTVQPDGSLRVQGWPELNQSLKKKNLLGETLDFLGKHDRLPTDAELAEMPKQGPNPTPAGRNNNSKEKNMSDFNESLEKEKDLSPKEKAFLNELHQRKVITSALKAGTLSCLPGLDGYADTQPAVNLVNGTPYHGSNLLYLKDHQKQNGFPTAEYVTSQQMDRAREDIPRLYPREGQKSVSLYVGEKNEQTGEWEEKQIKLFNIAQTTNPGDLKKWAEQKQQENAQEREEYKQQRDGVYYTPPEPRQKGPGPEITCKSTDPEKYLGQYLAAVSLGGKFKASPEQAAEFAQKMQDAMNEKLINKETGEPVLAKKGEHIGEPVSNPFKLSEISRNASGECRAVIRDIRMEARKAEQPEQKLDQQQSHSRKM